MADMVLVRHDGDGALTLLTVRVPDTAWAGKERHVEVLGVEHLASLDDAAEPCTVGKCADSDGPADRPCGAGLLRSPVVQRQHGAL